MAAGLRNNGSPVRKNESTVFSHLSSDGTERDGLKRRDIYDIPKPKVIPNNLSVQRQPSIGMAQGSAALYDMPPQQQSYGGAPEQDELSRQFDEYYKMQQKMNQLTVDAQRQPGRNSQNVNP